MEKDYVASISKALADTNRLAIVEMLVDGEKCGCELLERFSITQPTLSHHMKVLCESGLVKERRVGKWHHYSLDCNVLSSFQDFIASLECHKK